MMFFILFLTGLPIGIMMTAPVGPVNVMCIQQVLRYRARNGVLIGLGAVLADVLYALVGAFGVSVIIQTITIHLIWLEWIGGMILLGYGWFTWVQVPHLSMPGKSSTVLPFNSCLTAFLMTVSNPGTMLGILAILASMGDLRPDHNDPWAVIVFVGGLAIGALFWWVSLSVIVARLRKRLDDVWLLRINRAGSLLILFFAAFLLLRAAGRAWGFL